MAELSAPCRPPDNLAQEKPLLKPLFHIGGEVFIPTQWGHIDLHMLAMFFHNRQIEQNLVERVWAIHIDDGHHPPGEQVVPVGRARAGLQDPNRPI